VEVQVVITLALNHKVDKVVDQEAAEVLLAANNQEEVLHKVLQVAVQDMEVLVVMDTLAGQAAAVVVQVEVGKMLQVAEPVALEVMAVQII
jgi:hypothetical protein